MKMKKVLENQGLFLAEKERFELSRRYNRPTPLAGAPLRPLEYFSVYSSQSAVAWDMRHSILYTSFAFLSSPFSLFLKIKSYISITKTTTPPKQIIANVQTQMEIRSSRKVRTCASRALLAHRRLLLRLKPNREGNEKQTADAICFSLSS